MTSAPIPDRELMREFMDAYAYAAGLHGLLELAWSDRNGAVSKAQLFELSDIDTFIDVAIAKNSAGANVYIGAALRHENAPRNRRGAKTTVSSAPAVWADFDDEGALDAALAALNVCGLKPSFVTITGRQPYVRGQCWFFLEEPTPDLGQIEAINSALAASFGGDPSVKNRDRLMRLPGSIAWPTKQGRVVEPTHKRPQNDPVALRSLMELQRKLVLLNSDVTQATAPLRATVHANGHGEEAKSTQPEPWAAAALRAETRRVLDASDGERNNTLNRAAFSLGQIVGGGGLERALVESNLFDAARSIGLEERETRSTIKSGIESGMKELRQSFSTTARNEDAPPSEPLPLIPREAARSPYPVDALGGALAEAAHAIADIVCCPPAMAAQSVLSAAALGVQGHYDATHPLGHQVPVSLLLITVAESGERKSTADNLATEAVREYEKDAAEEYRRKSTDWFNRYEAWKASREKAKRGKRGDKRTASEIADSLRDVGPEPEEPIHYVRMLSDPNYEGLVKHMGRGQGSLAWFNNEAGQSIGGNALHEENKLKFGAGLSKLWDGQSLDRIRASEVATSLPGRRVTTHLMVQPDIARPFLSDPVLRSQGWLSRALIAEPESLIGSRKFREPTDADRARLAPFRTRLRELLDAECPHDGKANELTPHPLPWSNDARIAWIEFYNNIEAMLGDECELAEHRGFGAKLAENAFRIATIIAAFSSKREVDLHAMKRGIILARWYADEAVRYREGTIASKELLVAEKSRAMLTDPNRWPDDTITLRQFMQHAPSRAARKTKSSALAVITTLVNYGWLVPVEGSGGLFAIQGRP
jgi:hypothetical protein